ncbi:hypothetical protein LQL77_31200, partial [Rhodococcus cerastii]|nr:hypothetical protein [Rhodococcus cerastii]
TEAALEIMGKLHVLLESISEYATEQQISPIDCEKRALLHQAGHLETQREDQTGQWAIDSVTVWISPDWNGVDSMVEEASTDDGVVRPNGKCNSDDNL